MASLERCMEREIESTENDIDNREWTVSVASVQVERNGLLGICASEKCAAFALVSRYKKSDPDSNL